MAKLKITETDRRIVEVEIRITYEEGEDEKYKLDAPPYSLEIEGKADRVAFLADVYGEVESDLSLECGDIQGNVSAGGDITCSNLSGNLTAGGDVNCETVKGDVNSRGDVNCTEIKGSVISSGAVNADDFEDEDDDEEYDDELDDYDGFGVDELDDDDFGG